MQRYEAAFLKTVYDLYPDQILLYMHDGFVTNGKIDTQNVVDEYLDRTGFDISLEGKELSLT